MIEDYKQGFNIKNFAEKFKNLLQIHHTKWKPTQIARGEVRAYNWEAIWLSTVDFDEVDNPEEWWKSVKDAYEQLREASG